MIAGVLLAVSLALAHGVSAQKVFAHFMVCPKQF